MKTLRQQAIEIIQKQNERVRQDILNEDDDEVIALTTLGLCWEDLKEYLKSRYPGIKSGLVLYKMAELEKEAKGEPGKGGAEA